MFTWRLVVDEGRKAGHTFSQPELIIAATALHHGLTVVTRDSDDYKLARVPPLNPRTAESPCLPSPPGSVEKTTPDARIHLPARSPSA